MFNTEDVKAYLAKAKETDGRKEIIVTYLARLYEFMHIRFQKPRCNRVETLPFIPTEAERLIVKNLTNYLKIPFARVNDDFFDCVAHM